MTLHLPEKKKKKYCCEDSALVDLCRRLSAAVETSRTARVTAWIKKFDFKMPYLLINPFRRHL